MSLADDLAKQTAALAAISTTLGTDVQTVVGELQTGLSASDQTSIQNSISTLGTIASTLTGLGSTLTSAQPGQAVAPIVTSPVTGQQVGGTNGTGGQAPAANATSNAASGGTGNTSTS